MTELRRTLWISLLVCSTVFSPVSAQSREGLDPTIRAGETVAISDHVFVILDNGVSLVPNVGIVVGDRATLVIDTGLGEANGRIVLAEARGVANADKLYIAADQGEKRAAPAEA